MTLRREELFTLFSLGSPVFVLVLYYLCFFASMSITAQGFSARGLILLSSWLRDNGNLFTPKIACVGGVGGCMWEGEGVRGVHKFSLLC